MNSVNNQGYFVLKDAIGMEDLIEPQSYKGKDGDAVQFVECVSSGRLSDMLVQVFESEDYDIYSFKYHQLDPKEERRFWTNTFPYWKTKENETYTEDVKSMKVIIPLDEFCKDSGAPMIVPYSHTARCFPYIEYLKKGEFQSVERLTPQQEDELKGIGVDAAKHVVYKCQQKIIEAMPGDIIVINGMSWHTIGFNTFKAPTRWLEATFISEAVSEDLNAKKEQHQQHQ